MDRWELYNLLKGNRLEDSPLATIQNEVLSMNSEELKEGVIKYLYEKKRQSQQAV